MYRCSQSKYAINFDLTEFMEQGKKSLDSAIISSHIYFTFIISFKMKNNKMFGMSS